MVAVATWTLTNFSLNSSKQLSLDLENPLVSVDSEKEWKLKLTPSPEFFSM